MTVASQKHGIYVVFGESFNPIYTFADPVMLYNPVLPLKVAKIGDGEIAGSETYICKSA